MKYGSVTASHFGACISADSPYYNYETGAINYQGYVDFHHALSIVGWDDNYSIDNFNPENKPEKPGAWIVRDSIGDFGVNHGYFYYSYEDITINAMVTGIRRAVPIENGKKDYDNLYQAGYAFSWDWPYTSSRTRALLRCKYL